MHGTGQICLTGLHRLIGFPLELKKHVPPSAQFVFLGVVTDLAKFMTGVVEMGLKPGRAASVAEAMRIFEAGGFSVGAARSSLDGKLYFTISTAFGRVGNAALQVLRRYEF